MRIWLPLPPKMIEVFPGIGILMSDRQGFRVWIKLPFPAHWHLLHPSSQTPLSPFSQCLPLLSMHPLTEDLVDINTHINTSCLNATARIIIGSTYWLKQCLLLVLTLLCGWEGCLVEYITPSAQENDWSSSWGMNQIPGCGRSGGISINFGWHGNRVWLKVPFPKQKQVLHPSAQRKLSPSFQIVPLLSMHPLTKLLNDMNRYYFKSISIQ